jgi:Flp pilus assembly protein TadD
MRFGQRVVAAMTLAYALVSPCTPACRGQEKSDADAAPLLAEAESLMKAGRPQQAISLLLPFDRDHPGVPGVQAKLGKAYYEIQDTASAVARLQTAVQQNSTDWESTQLLAIAKFTAGNCQQSTSLLQKVIPHLPEGQADAEHLLGVCYLRLHNFADARAAFAKTFAVEKDSAMAYFVLAKMMVGQQMEDFAIPEIHKAIELDPRLAMAHFLLGEISLTKSDLSQALSEFRKELSINPSVWLVYWRLGDTYMRLQRNDDAEQALKQALWLNDSFTGGYLMLGEIELRKGEPDLASRFLEHAIKLDPQNPYGHYFLGRAYQKVGRIQEADREFELERTMRTSKHQEESGSLQTGP